MYPLPTHQYKTKVVVDLNHFFSFQTLFMQLLFMYLLNRRRNAQLNSTWLHNNKLFIQSRHQAYLLRTLFMQKGNTVK